MLQVGMCLHQSSNDPHWSLPYSLSSPSLCFLISSSLPVCQHHLFFFSLFLLITSSSLVHTSVCLLCTCFCFTCLVYVCLFVSICVCHDQSVLSRMRSYLWLHVYFFFLSVLYLFFVGEEWHGPSLLLPSL